MEGAAQAATILMGVLALVVFVSGAQYVSRRREASRPLAGRAYEETKRAVTALGQDYLYKAAEPNRWESETAPLIDTAESSLSRVVVEGRWAVRRKAGKLSDKLTDTRNLAYATVGLLRSGEVTYVEEMRTYGVLHGELVEALEEFKKKARR